MTEFHLIMSDKLMYNLSQWIISGYTLHLNVCLALKYLAHIHLMSSCWKIIFSSPSGSQLSLLSVLPCPGFSSFSRCEQICPFVLNHSAACCSVCTCRRSPPLSCRSWSCHRDTAGGCVVSWSGRWRSATLGHHGGSSTCQCDHCLRSSWAAGGPEDTPQHTPAPWWGWHWCTGHQRCTLWTSAPCSPLDFDQGLQHEKLITITVLWLI